MHISLLNVKIRFSKNLKYDKIKPNMIVKSKYDIFSWRDEL